MRAFYTHEKCALPIETLWLTFWFFFLQGPDHPHCLSYKLELGSDQEIPSDWYPFATVQFGILDTTASRTEVRSLGVESDVQPQKHIHHRACYNIQVHPKAPGVRMGLSKLWPDLALDPCLAFLSNVMCMHVLDLEKSSVLETWWSPVSLVLPLSSREH